MSNLIKQRAQEARDLLANPVFMAVSADILGAASELFLNSNSGIDILSRAHEGVRAVQKFKDALQSRIDAEAVLLKGKGQDRAND